MFFTALSKKSQNAGAEAGKNAPVSGSCPLLFIMDRPLFEKLVHDSLRHLPRRFKQKLVNIAIEIEDRPSPALLHDMGIEHGTLFGLYQGVPLTEREWNYGNVLPDRIVIYQHPIEQAAQSNEEIEEIVMDTVMHEIGHYFGFGDKELYSIEDEKRKKKGK
jgi:predicted Zn-dependent protease with MMP-like domain